MANKTHIILQLRQELEETQRRLAEANASLRLDRNRLQLGDQSMAGAVAPGVSLEKHRISTLRRMADLEAHVAERTSDLSASRLAALNMMEEAVEGRKAVETANHELLLEIAARKQAETSIQLALAEKTVLLNEVHHRVKNNLAIMVSLINMQSRQTRHPDVLAALVDTKARLFSISLLHEVLYRSGRMDRVEITSYIGQLCAHLAESLGMLARGIHIQSRWAAPLTLAVDQAVPCGLMVSELVTNAIEHAFSDGRHGKVIVELEHPTPDSIILRVSDNGLGIPGDFKIDQVSSVGLSLVNALTQQLSGSLDIQNDHGTRVEIRFPL